MKLELKECRACSEPSAMRDKLATAEDCLGRSGGRRQGEFTTMPTARGGRRVFEALRS